MTAVTVRADHALLPHEWWLDPLLSEPVYRRITQLHKEGYSMYQIARTVGCNSRTVQRFLRREGATTG